MEPVLREGTFAELAAAADLLSAWSDDLQSRKSFTRGHDSSIMTFRFHVALREQGVD